MAFNPTSPLAGTPVTGLTSPTFTFTSDQPANPGRQKQWIVSGIGGTQTGTEVHSITKPFSVMVSRPEQVKTPGRPDALGLQRTINYNKWSIVTRVGVKINAAGQIGIARFVTEETIPAGAETYDAATIKSALSMHSGFIVQNANGNIDTITVGTV